MSLAVLSLLALLGVVAVGGFLSVNLGLLSIALAFLIGVLVGGMKLGTVVAGFPAGLFLTLIGVTLLFSQARANGTLERVSAAAIALARGRAGVIPVVFFLLALMFSSIGPGNIAAVALLAPVAMAAAGRAGVPAFLMAIMVCTGANAGALSPFAPTGIIANSLMANIGLVDVQWQNYFNSLVAQSFVGFAGYLLFGGARLLKNGAPTVTAAQRAAGTTAEFGAAGLTAEHGAVPIPAFTWQQKLTLGVVAVLILSVVFLDVDVTVGAFLGATVLGLARAADEKEALKGMPWSVILMVCGVTVLIGVVDRSGGMEMLTSMLSAFSTRETITGVIALVAGVMSVYSSSSGVVLPAFLPTIPGLIDKLGGGDALAIALSINVGSHLVDVSPLSTLGALCIANAAPGEDRKRLFNQMLAWGLSMCLVGALVCWVFFGVL